MLHCTWYAYNTVRVSYAYIRTEQFPGRIVRLRVLVLYCIVKSRVYFTVKLLYCKILYSTLQYFTVQHFIVLRYLGNDVHVLSRPLAYSGRIVRIIRIRVSYAYIRVFFLVTHV